MIKLRGFRWVIGVVVAYLLLLGAAIGAAFFEFRQCNSDNEALCFLVGAIVVVLLAQAAMLWVPVQVTRSRPISRRGLWIPLLGSGLLSGLLVLGAGLALAELFRIQNSWTGWGILLLAVASWGFWCILFWMISGRQDPGAIAHWLHRWLLAGSALELIIAVTAHIIVRRRNECCAGISTGLGIACGIAVGVAAFGPAVAFLFIARCRKLQAPKTGFDVLNLHPTNTPPKELPKP